MRLQWAVKDVNRFVVSTPPQSIRSAGRGCAPTSSVAPACGAWPASLAIGDLLGLARELEHTVAELLEVGVVGRARHSALVVALHEHDRLPPGARCGTCAGT